MRGVHRGNLRGCLYPVKRFHKKHTEHQGLRDVQQYSISIVQQALTECTALGRNSLAGGLGPTLALAVALSLHSTSFQQKKLSRVLCSGWHPAHVALPVFHVCTLWTFCVVTCNWSSYDHTPSVYGERGRRCTTRCELTESLGTEVQRVRGAGACGLFVFSPSLPREKKPALSHAF